MTSTRMSAASAKVIMGALAVAASIPAWAQASGIVLITPDEMRWQQWGSTQRSMFLGDAAVFDCPYVDRIKFPSGFKVPEHSFQQDKEFTVLSGVMHVGVGDKWDDSKLKRLPAGSFWRIPANVSYFFRTEGEVVMQTSTKTLPGKECSTKATGQP